MSRDVQEGGAQTQPHRAERLFADAASVLASSLDYEQTLASLADLIVQDVADVCVIDIVEDGNITRLQVANRDPGQADLTRELLRFPLDRQRSHLSLEALESRRPVLLRDVTDAMLESLSQSEEHLRILRTLGPRSLMAVPMLARERLLAVVLFVSTSGSYGAENIELAEKLVHLAALQVDNARLYGEATRALQARDRVLGIVAHDLRNPLNVITMSADFLLDVSLPETQRNRQVQMIGRSAQRMNRLIQDLLDVAKLEADRFPLDREIDKPATLAREAVELSAPSAEAKSLRLRCDSTNDVPTISADRDRILQVLSNLIGNAIKFTPDGGRVDVSLKASEEGAHFSVADTGPGIPADQIPYLFQPFWQGQRRSIEGAGLGLAIARGIVEAHGGTIWAESTPGQGSTFHFTIPAVSTPHDDRRVGVADRRSQDAGRIDETPTRIQG